jgi:HD-like signal output (HDOD) protein
MTDNHSRYGEPDSLTYRSTNRSVAAERSSAHTGVTALSFLTTLANELSKGPVDLPCFPNVVIKIRDALNDPDTTADETVVLVGAEPRLAAKLLQTANSAAFNSSGKRVTDLRTAITRLGQQLVQGTAMAFAVQQMKNEPSLRSIAKPLSELWKVSITVAYIAKVLAKRTTVQSDEAFLTGLLHGIGKLYIMARSVGLPASAAEELASAELVSGWHPSVGKAVLENWQVAEEMSDAVGDQNAYDRVSRREADLTDVLIIAVILAQALQEPEPRDIQIDGVTAFQRVGLRLGDCDAILKHAEYQLGSLHDALGC